MNKVADILTGVAVIAAIGGLVGCHGAPNQTATKPAPPSAAEMQRRADLADQRFQKVMSQPNSHPNNPEAIAGLRNAMGGAYAAGTGGQ